MLRSFFPDNIKEFVNKYPEKLGIHIMRFMFALLWLTQGMVKLVNRSPDQNSDFNGFLGQLYWMSSSHPSDVASSILDNFIIPNVSIFIFLIIAGELFTAISLGTGFLSRLGAITGMLMSATFWYFTQGWGEWEWTYPLILTPHILFFLSSPGREIGVDRVLVSKYNKGIWKYLL